jgi:mono/diheme cytochrome c family protein
MVSNAARQDASVARPAISQRLARGLCALLIGAVCLQASATGQQPSPPPSGTALVSSQRVLLDTYCVGCHNGRVKTAGLTLDAMSLDKVPDSAEVWERVLRKVRTGQMPPAGRPRPDHASLTAFADWLETTLDRSAMQHPNPGRATVHRLSRVEYGNAVRDLLGLDVDVRALLPPDDAAFGFDNNADVLSVSPALLERYLLAARKIARLATGDMTIRPVVESYRISPLLLQSDRMSEDLPFGTRGGVAVRHYFPLDGEYVLRIQLQRGYGGTIRGLGRAQEVEVRLDGARVTTFAVGGTRPNTNSNQPRLAGEALSRSVEEPLEVRFSAKAGMRLVGVAFQKQTAAAARA